MRYTCLRIKSDFDFKGLVLKQRHYVFENDLFHSLFLWNCTRYFEDC